MLPTKYTQKSQIIWEFVIEPLLSSASYLNGIPKISSLSENKISDHIVRFLQSHSKYAHLYQTLIIARVRPTIIHNAGPNNQPDLEIIVFTTTHSILFEAKKLKSNGSPSEYCGKDGLGRFTSGYYPVKDFCGMLGYLHGGNAKKNKIKKRISRISREKIFDINTDCFLSSHKHQSNIFSCFHVMLNLN